MHRRGLQCKSALSASLRCFHNTTLSQSSRPARAKRQVDPAIADLTDRVVKQAAFGQRHVPLGDPRNGKPRRKEQDGKGSKTSLNRNALRNSVIKGGPQRHLEAAVRKANTPDHPPSPEKRQFSAVYENELDYLMGLDFAVGSEVSGQTLKADVGTFVELRRNAQTTHGVVVGTIFVDSQQHILTLTSTGEVLQHFSEDVFFAIPDFVDKNLGTRCSALLVAENEHQIAARVRVLQRVRELEKAVSSKYNQISSTMNQAYDTFKNPDPNKWGHVTTSEVASHLLGVSDEALDPILVLTVHKHLMRRSLHFVANQVQFLSTHIFWIRPQSEIATLEKVSDMVQRKDPVLDSFAQKMRQAILQNREIAKTTSEERPSIKPIAGLRLTEDESTILSFLKDTYRSKRTSQRDPSVVPLSHVVKKIAYADGSKDENLVHFETLGIDNHTVGQLLIDVGALPAWEDPSASEHGLYFLEQDGTEQQLPTIARKVQTSLEPLGPTDFYTSDIMDSLRHDFGDLPAYVVDDFDAEELDDALSVEPVAGEPDSYWIHVHIADPTAVLPPTHQIAKHAHRQTTSLYWIHGTTPMLPHEEPLSKLSLGDGLAEGRPDKTMTFSFKVNAMGDISDYKVRAGLIRNINVIKYDEMNAALGLSDSNYISYPFGGAPELPPYRKFTEFQVRDMRALHNVARHLVDARVRADTVSTYLPSLDLKSSPKPPPTNPFDVSQPIHSVGFPEITYAVRDQNCDLLDSRATISEMMKAAGRVGSRFFVDRNIPVLRRSAGRLIVPSDEVFADLLALRDHAGIIPYPELVRHGAIFPAAVYTTKPLGHWQLGIPDGEGYIRVTSPLRRYTDLLTHWQIKHALLSPSSPVLFDEDYLRDIITETMAKELRLRKAETTHKTNWAVKFLQRWQQFPEKHRDIEDPLQYLECQVCATPIEDTITRKYSSRVLFPSIGMRGQLKELSGPEEVRVGDTLPVKIAELKTGLSPRVAVVRR